MQFNSSQSTFGAVAGKIVDPTVRAGRYSVQKEAERRILPDLLPKLQIEPHHRLLDIGCGAGILVVGLSQLVREVVGIDHPDVIAELGKVVALPNVTLIGGSFPNTPIQGQFDRIVAYSVMQCNSDYAAALAFVRAAAALLSDNGRMVIADIPSSDRRARFQASARGKAFEAEWAALRAAHPVPTDEKEAIAHLGQATMLGALSDKQILEMAATLRADGFDVWLAPQSPDLPFGNTREDMIIVRP
jgi:2-polyprenyl-3-methyl-5-hydroxy-6-metoxy-1,4-benzoquinol methylase